MEYKTISWDWKESPSEQDLKRIAEFFGGYVYSDPALEGSDCYGYIFSKTPLTPEQLKQIEN